MILLSFQYDIFSVTQAWYDSPCIPTGAGRVLRRCRNMTLRLPVLLQICTMLSLEETGAMRIYASFDASHFVTTINFGTAYIHMAT